MNTKVIISTLLLFIGCQLSHAQSVLGIPFKSSYEKTKSSLEKRFGKYHVSEDNGKLAVYGLMLGDFPFKTGDFMFQYQGDFTYFNAATFSNWYELNQLDIAKSDRDFLYSLLKDKYADEFLEEYTNEQGFKCYKFGLNPVDDSKVLGLITLHRGAGKDGEERYYLMLDYLPIHYLDKASDF